MLEDLIRKKIEDALKIIDDIKEDYKLETYKIILPFLLKGLVNISKLEEGVISSKVSLSELIAKLKPNTYTDTAIIISYFLFKYEGIIIFNIDNIKNGFDEIRAVKPKNMTDTLNSLIKRGLLRTSSDVDNKKGFEITKMGIEYSEEMIRKLS